MSFPRSWAAPALLAAALLAWPGPAAAQTRVLVYAAASLKTALDELAPAFTRELGTPVRVSYAASSALARQIEAGAPAGVFISADVDWMDYLAARHLVRADTRVRLLGNRLVLIAPAASGVRLRIAPGFGLAAALGHDGRLALADPAAVPAGRYARAALTTLGVWTDVRARLAPAENVRAALELVARGEAPLGIVYRTDAIAEPRVRVVDVFPESTHPPIVYPAAVTTSGGDVAVRLLALLQSAASRAVFTRNGFQPLAH